MIGTYSRVFFKGKADGDQLLNPGMITCDPLSYARSEDSDFRPPTSDFRSLFLFNGLCSLIRVLVHTRFGIGIGHIRRNLPLGSLAGCNIWVRVRVLNTWRLIGSCLLRRDFGCSRLGLDRGGGRRWGRWWSTTLFSAKRLIVNV